MNTKNESLCCFPIYDGACCSFKIPTSRRPTLSSLYLAPCSRFKIQAKNQDPRLKVAMMEVVAATVAGEAKAGRATIPTIRAPSTTNVGNEESSDSSSNDE
jgi:hypothetical protein